MNRTTPVIPQEEIRRQREYCAQIRTLNSRLPGVGDTVTTPDGVKGQVQSVSVLRQTVKVLTEKGDVKEVQEYKVNQLKFRPRKKKVKVTKEELKELKNLEDKN